MSCERSGGDSSPAQLWSQARPGEQSHGLPDRSRLHSGDKWDIISSRASHRQTATNLQFCLAQYKWFQKVSITLKLSEHFMRFYILALMEFIWVQWIISMTVKNKYGSVQELRSVGMVWLVLVWFGWLGCF